MSRNSRLQPLLIAAGFAALWILLAAWRPTTTWHLAPAVVAAAPLVSTSSGFPQLVRVAGGLGLAVGVALALAASGAMRGPSLLPVGGPLLESVVAAVSGTVVGLAVAGRS